MLSELEVLPTTDSKVFHSARASFLFLLAGTIEQTWCRMHRDPSTENSDVEISCECRLVIITFVPALIAHCVSLRLGLRQLPLVGNLAIALQRQPLSHFQRSQATHRR